MSPETALAEIAGSAWVREARPTDDIDGVRPELVVSPGSVEEVSAVLRAASEARWRVAPRGTGSKLALGGRPEGVEVVLDLTRLDRVLEHAAGDLIVAVESGVPFDRLQAKLAAAEQMLGLDPSSSEATIGGIVATNESGPRRLRYGTVRDSLIGVTIVLADGTIAKAGGKVVKNVAGYDLSKLMTGSLGTLGVIVRAVFRLHPRPSAHGLVEVEVEHPEDVQAVADRLSASTLVPSAFQTRWDDDGRPAVGVLFEGTEAGVAAQAAGTATLLRDRFTPRIVAGNAAIARWSDRFVPHVTSSLMSLKISCLPSQFGATLSLAKAQLAVASSWRMDGMVATGVLQIQADVEPEAAARVIGTLRKQIGRGTVVVTRAPRDVKQRVDVWGPVGSSLELMRRVKARFDPDRILNPGRFVGGL